MTTRLDCAAIVGVIAELGRSLDIDTTAEGVETFEQFIFLRTCGCKLAQGYFFSRPVPARDLSLDYRAASAGVRASAWSTWGLLLMERLDGDTAWSRAARCGPVRRRGSVSA